MKKRFRESGKAHLVLLSMAFLLLGLNPAIAAVGFEAESGSLGSGISLNSGPPIYITAVADGAGGNPGGATRVASYTVNFPASGTYKLYGRVRVGSGSASDDSFFYANGFGTKSPTNDADWILVNSVNLGGFTNSTDVVSGSGAAGISVWKRISFSDYTGTAGEAPISFVVPSGNLTQTFAE